jgi:hypothetical protein
MEVSKMFFTCKTCGVSVQDRWPIREGNSWDNLFCSLPCAWMDRCSGENLDRLCKWLSLAETYGSQSIITSMVRLELIAAGRICWLIA